MATAKILTRFLGITPLWISLLLRTIALLVLITRFAVGQDDRISLREQEAALASALRARNKVELLRLTDGNLNVSWECGSAVRSFIANVSRDEWVDVVSHLRINSYVANIAAIHLVDGRDADNKPVKFHEFAQVGVNEHLNIRLPRGAATATDLVAVDNWIKRGDTWKLTSRMYKLDACPNAPN